MGCDYYDFEYILIGNNLRTRRICVCRPESSLSPLCDSINRPKDHIKRLQIRHTELKESVSLLDMNYREGCIIHNHFQGSSVACVNNPYGIG